VASKQSFVEIWHKAVVSTDESGSRTTPSILYDHVHQPCFKPSCSARRCTSDEGSVGVSIAAGTGVVAGVAPAGSGTVWCAHLTETAAGAVALRL
jgi:hypothetical protein